jgi:probable F420-dependent oxidoreductase
VNSRVDIDVAIPQTFPNRPVDRHLVREHLTRAEKLGFRGAWVVEQILGSIPSLEPVHLLTYAAAVTERLRLGSAVLLTALRSPIHLAKSLATIDHLSDGRLVVGVGLGGNPRVYPAYGLSAERRAARFAESVTVMKKLWTEPRVTFDGQFWKLQNASMEPKPVQRPHPPVWFGAHHPNALKRAVELGNGFIGAGSSSTKTFVDEVRTLGPLLRAAGRAPEEFPIGKRVYIAVDDDRARAGRRLAEWFQAFYGRPELAAEVSVWGDREQCLDALREIVAGGARFLLLNPAFDELEHLERLAEIGAKL